MRLIALDLHQDNIVTAVLDYSTQARPLPARRYGLDEGSLAEFTGHLGKDDIVVMESTFNAFWLYQHISPLVRSCHVLNVNAVHLRGNKTDTLDARKLLEVLSTFVVTDTLHRMPTVFVPPENVTKLRSLFSSYRLLKKSETQLRNRIHAIYRQNGVVIDRKELGSAKYRATLMKDHPLLDYWREQVQTFLETLELIIPKQVRLKRAILSLAIALFPEEVRLLTTIPGFSPLTAAAFMSDVADINRFASAKKLCAYLRTAPSIKSSNKTRHLGPVSKCGRSLTVSLLTQSVNHLKTASPSYADFYNRLRTGKSAGKCRIALIRKTLTTAYYMLRRGTEFDHKNVATYERKHKALNRFMKDYQPPLGEKQEVQTV
jgi:transposase